VTRGNVLYIADAETQILGRLSRAWMKYSSSRRPHEVIYTSKSHAFEVRRRGEEAGLIFWVDPLAFAAFPRAVRVPQSVMVHHLTEPEVDLFLGPMRAADALATSSVRWQRRLERLVGITPTLVPYVLDTDLFRPADRLAARRRIGIRDDAYVIGFSAKALADAFGRKGIDLFVDVAAAAAKEWSDITVLLIGSGWESLATIIEATGARVVHVAPTRTEDTAELYPAMDVFLCTSKEEGGPCTIMEAMGAEVPVITTDVGHVPEVVSDGETGFVMQQRDVGEFVGRIRCLRADADLRARMTRAAREFIVAHRDERNVVPAIPFDAMYREAEERFRARGSGERAARAAGLAYLGARYAARRAAAWSRKR
jgi:glycosyltransferase involved in cell wall biosynthesis